jgi:hypothetical protein
MGVWTAVAVRQVAQDLRAAEAGIRHPFSRQEASLRATVSSAKAASNRLASPPLSLVGRVPLAGHNVAALRRLSSGARAAASYALRVRRGPASPSGGGLRSETAARLEAAARRGAAIAGAIAARLQPYTDDAWLLPPVWSAVSASYSVAGSTRRRLDTTARALNALEGILAGPPRPYLVMLLNNAELRGAGGLLSAVGTIEIGADKVKLKRLYSADRLKQDPPVPVSAPRDYARRFATFKANTTLWVNTSFSPDIPDVAVVGARLYARQRGVKTAGAVVLDPRGLAEVLRPSSPLHVPGLDHPIRARAFPRFVYTRSYQVFPTRDERHRAILAAASDAMRAFFDRRMAALSQMRRMQKAVVGGHVRMVPFDRSRQAAFDSAGITGKLEAPRGPEVFVTADNFGDGHSQGTKLDYWVDRRVELACRLAPGARAVACSLNIDARNRTPLGLRRVVNGKVLYGAGRPYGTARDYFQAYVPEDARITRLTLDGKVVTFRVQREDGYKVLGVFVKTRRLATSRIEIDFTAPGGRTLEFGLRPQPLAHDAHAELALSVPPSWEIHSSSGVPLGRRLRYSGDLDRPLEWKAVQAPAPGLAGVWRWAANLFSR